MPAAVDSGTHVHRVAPSFEVSVSYIYKALTRRRLNGISPRHCRRAGFAGRKLDQHLDAIIAHLAERPDIALAELADRSKAEPGVSMCAATMGAALAALGIGLKRRRTTVPRRSARTWWPRADSGG